MTNSISAAGRRDRLERDDDVTSVTPPPSPKATTSPTVQTHVDAGIAAAAKNAILYLGLNSDSSSTELATLQAATHGNVSSVLSHRGTGIDTDFGQFDLGNKPGVKAFVDGLVGRFGLTNEQGAAIEGTLDDMHFAGRDEIGRLALLFASAEVGESALPGRLVLSGHSSLGEMWGQSSVIKLEDVCALGKALPKAAAQVEDIHFSGCNTAPELQNHAVWTEAFPNLATMWGYNGFSDHAPVQDLRTWETATRGDANAISDDAFTARNNAVAWTTAQGMVDPAHDARPLDYLQGKTRDADSRYAAYVRGDEPIPHPHDCQAATDYMAYYQLSMRSDVSPAEHSAATQQAQVMLRLRYYETSVRGEFQKENGKVVGEAFNALGLTVPDFSTLSRKDANAKIDEFRRAAQRQPNANVAEAAQRLTELASLDPKAIPSFWCH